MKGNRFFGACFGGKLNLIANMDVFHHPLHTNEVCRCQCCFGIESSMYYCERRANMTSYIRELWCRIPRLAREHSWDIYLRAMKTAVIEISEEKWGNRNAFRHVRWYNRHSTGTVLPKSWSGSMQPWVPWKVKAAVKKFWISSSWSCWSRSRDIYHFRENVVVTVCTKIFSRTGMTVTDFCCLHFFKSKGRLVGELVWAHSSLILCFTGPISLGFFSFFLEQRHRDIQYSCWWTWRSFLFAYYFIVVYLLILKHAPEK